MLSDVVLKHVLICFGDLKGPFISILSALLNTLEISLYIPFLIHLKTKISLLHEVYIYKLRLQVLTKLTRSTDYFTFQANECICGIARGISIE